ncbi:MAG: porin [Porphyromonas sp.]|nr:porin [Porphyromonas sp.]
MKSIFKIFGASALLLGLSLTASAQQEHYTDNKSLAETVGLIKEKQDKFNLYLNINSSLDLRANNDGFEGANFTARQLRIEAKGNITDWLSYRWRQRLNRPNNGGGNIDNLPTSIDIAGIGVSPTEKFSMFLGKQCAAYGGIEFDLNPIEIYEYSDMIEYMSNFLTGVNFAYDFEAGQQLQFQVLNGRNGSYAETYPGTTVDEAKIPFVYTLNWNGTIAPFWTTRWSISHMSQSKEHSMQYLALGNHFDFGPFNGHFDFMYSNEGLNRKMIIPDIEDVEYTSFLLKLNYNITPAWNLFAKGMYETAGAGNGAKWFNGDKVRESYGYYAGVEYYPFEDNNLHFFMTYIGRTQKLMATDFSASNHKVLLGFIYQLKMF